MTLQAVDAALGNATVEIERHLQVARRFLHGARGLDRRALEPWGPSTTGVLPKSTGDVLPNLLDTMQQRQPREGHFRLIEVSAHPAELIIVLAGVEDLTLTATNAWTVFTLTADPVQAGAAALATLLDRPRGNPRDLAVAIPQHLFGIDGDYTKRVMAATENYLTARGLAPGTPVTIVGHSHGAMTAVSLASNRSFNGAVVKVKTVIAAGGGQVGNLGKPVRGTDVLVLTNTVDIVSAGLAATDVTTSRPRGDDRFEIRRNVGIGADAGHGVDRYETIAANLGTRGDAIVAEAFSSLVGKPFVAVEIPLYDEAKTISGASVTKP